MMVQLSVISYGYHLVTQDKVDNGMSSRSCVNKTKSVWRSRPSRPAEKGKITGGPGKQAGDAKGNYYK